MKNPMKRLITICLCALQGSALAATYEERGVAAVLMGEAWSEGPRGMTAVAEVIHQRAVEKGKAPLDIILSRRGQYHAFSSLNGTTLDRLVQKYSLEPDFQKALQIAQTACETPSRLPGLANFANHFTRASEHPYWARGQEPVAIIGHHAFYRLARY
jgi:spore germination cell wall hydrolase CwlJ-like protein